jgi:hypothetical protein
MLIIRSKLTCVYKIILASDSNALNVGCHTCRRGGDGVESSHIRNELMVLCTELRNTL